jgi:ubiquinone/menaquinone biosynthesis C-methylase UbiE
MKSKPHYGYYALPIMTGLSTLIILAGILVFLFVMQIIGIIILAFGVYLVVSYGISIHFMRQDRAEDVSEILKLVGNENVLDVGCGLGKLTNGIAKQLKDGKVIGIDIWDKMEIPGNSAEKAYENAEIEGVRDKVEFSFGNVLDIPFPDTSFDLVTSSSVLNNLHGMDEKLKALQEIYRVTTPGGRFLLVEPLRNLRGFFTFTPFAFWMLLKKDDWIRLLQKSNFVVYDYLYRYGVGWFVVERPINIKSV